ncbi:MAG TPA: ABC transporter permease [Acidobacteria bacterium]|nr:ABC transporter permease [Acidobacteriota bacterium]
MTGFLAVLRKEARAILTDPVIMLTVIGGVVFYSFLYPLPYSGQVPREQPVAVVDLDNSTLSRQLTRWIDATPEVRVAARPGSLAEAEELITRHRIAGLVLIKENFRRDLLLGRPVHLAVAGDATFFLVYGAVAEGVATAAGTLGAQIKVGRLLAGGEEARLAARRWTSFGLNARPVFNTTLGYINYVVPAVFILILQQTLLIGLGVLGGTQNALRLAGEAGYWTEHPAWQVLVARTAVFFGLYAILSLYYLGFCFVYYVVPRHAAPGAILLLALPFLLAVIGLGTVLGQLLTRRDLATQIVLFSSLPLVFTAGFVWPTHLVPWPLLALANLVPSTPAIQAFLRLNQMGATFHQIAPLWTQLWIQALVYGALAWWLLHRNAVAAGRSRAVST